jgi:ABC-type lipoprotein export system ATPase subunit/ABC-type antimicrobial peptide transport system permease subunit
MLELLNIRRCYKDSDMNEVVALENVSLKLPRTGLVVITGTSGCGKTTLLNILGGLDKPSEGEVRWNGIRIDDKNEEWWDAYRSSYLGFIYQDFNLLENMSVKENIRLPLLLQGIDEYTQKERIKDISDKLGIGDYLNKKGGKLSGGQKQRVAIARALVTGSKIILADEPTGNLDHENSENVFSLLQMISKERLVVVVTHDISMAEKYADMLVKISYGKIENINERNVIEYEKESKLSSEGNIVIKRNRLPFSESITLIKESLNKRIVRCIISIAMFSITSIFILLLCEAIFRKDGSAFAKYIDFANQKVVSLCIKIPDEYEGVAQSDAIEEGKKLYGLISQSVDESRIIRYGNSDIIKIDDENFISTNCIYVNESNEKYFTYKGKFPANSNEIAVSKQVADKLGGDVLGKKIELKKNTVTVTALIEELDGENIESIYVDDGCKEDIFENLIIKPNNALKDEHEEPYILGFGVIHKSNLLYQTTVFNYVASADDVIQLVEGHVPQKDNEVLISAALVSSGNSAYNDIVGKSYSLVDLYDQQYGCSFYDNINLYDYLGEEFTVVGVAEGNADFYVTPSIYNGMSEEYEMYYQNKFGIICDDDYLQGDINTLMNEGIDISDSVFDKVYSLIENVNEAKKFLIIIIVVVAFLAILQMISLYSYSISDNKKNIGILRTIGVNKSDTKKIFAVECFVVTMVSDAIALLASVLLTLALNQVISINIIELANFKFLRIRVVVVAMMAIISVILSMLSVGIPLRKYSKVKIIDLIK